MDTCLVVTPLKIEQADAFVEEAKVRLMRGFAFYEYMNESLENTTRAAQERLHVYSEVEISERGSPYEWLRSSGAVTIGEDQHDLNIFVYPISKTEASASFCFSNSLFDALFGTDTAFGEVVEEDVKRALIGLFSEMADVSGAKAFAYGWMRSDEDMIPLTYTDDFKRWLEEPDRELIAKNPYFLVGIRSELVDRHRAEHSWPANRFKLATSGFLLLDGIGPTV
jgi:hypothetical protein